MIVIAGGILLALLILVCLRVLVWVLVGLAVLVLAVCCLEWIEAHAALAWVLGLSVLACWLAARRFSVR